MGVLTLLAEAIGGTIHLMGVVRVVAGQIEVARRAAGRGQLDDDLLLVETDGIEVQTDPVGKDSCKDRGKTHKGDSTNGNGTTRASVPLVLPPLRRSVAAPLLDKNQVYTAVYIGAPRDIESGRAGERAGGRRCAGRHRGDLRLLARPLRGFEAMDASLGDLSRGCSSVPPATGWQRQR